MTRVFPFGVWGFLRRDKILRGMWTSPHLKLLTALAKYNTSAKYPLPYLSEIPIEAKNGKTYQADILIGKRLIVEVDGPIHLKHIQKDDDRDGELKALGYTTIRFSNKLIEQDVNAVVNAISEVYGKI